MMNSTIEPTSIEVKFKNTLYTIEVLEFYLVALQWSLIQDFSQSKG